MLRAKINLKVYPAHFMLRSTAVRARSIANLKIKKFFEAQFKLLLLVRLEWGKLQTIPLNLYLNKFNTPQIWDIDMQTLREGWSILAI